MEKNEARKRVVNGKLAEFFFTIPLKIETVDLEIKEIRQRTEEANKKYENLINEIKEMIDETKESIIKYSQLKFHEDISSSINTLSKNQIFDLLDHLYDFKEFDELKKYLQNLKI